MATLIGTVLELESGDRLSRAEFHRRYCARRDIKRMAGVLAALEPPPPFGRPRPGVG